MLGSKRERYSRTLGATYGKSRGIISGQRKNARLIAVTTSSSMGRSSVYNRLKLDGVDYFKSIGYTGGWGHFHIPDRLFSELRSYLRRIDHSYADRHQFGAGPNWRFRTTRTALKALGFRDNLLRHGIRREVFISFLVSEGVEYLRTGMGEVDYSAFALRRRSVFVGTKTLDCSACRAGDLTTGIGNGRNLSRYSVAIAERWLSSFHE